MTARSDEGRRVLRNAASIGAFLASPLIMWLMIRAFGAGGYGRWWAAFVVVEAATILGNFGTDLYVRREVSRLTHEGRDDEIPAVVGSVMFVVGSLGLGFLAIQLALASPICSLHDDPELLPYLVILGVQPVLTGVSGAMGAALQSRNVLGTIAVFRGLVFPALTALVLAVGWQNALPPWLTLLGLVGLTFAGLVVTVLIYRRHLPLAPTVRAITRPVHARAALRFGARLMPPIVLFVFGGKLDLYVLGAYYDPVFVGIYAGCLQIASSLPNTRALLDPVIQTQVGALYGAAPAELGRSLQRLTRICVFALAPSFVMLIAIGEPVLGWLLGSPVPQASVSLTILSIGQLIGSMAVASWVVPMMLSGRVLGAIAGTMLIVKVVLLLILVPDLGMLGAAIPTALGTMIAMQGQALTGARVLGHRPYAFSLVPVLLVMTAIAVADRILYQVLATRIDDVMAVAITGCVGMTAVLAAVLGLLDADERRRLRQFLRLGSRLAPP